jgi:hypothetical protein
MVEQHAYTDSQKHAYDQGIALGSISMNQLWHDGSVDRWDVQTQIDAQNNAKAHPLGTTDQEALNKGMAHGLATAFADHVRNLANSPRADFQTMADVYNAAAQMVPSENLASDPSFKPILPMLALIDLNSNFNHIHNPRNPNSPSKMTLDEVNAYNTLCQRGGLEQATIDFAAKNFKQLTEFSGGQGGLTAGDIQSGRNRFTQLEKQWENLASDYRIAGNGQYTEHTEWHGSRPTIVLGPDESQDGIKHRDRQAEQTLKYLDTHYDELLDKNPDGTLRADSGISHFKIAHKEDMLCAKDATTETGASAAKEFPNLTTSAKLTVEQRALQDADTHFAWYTNLDSNDAPQTGYTFRTSAGNADGITRRDITKGLEQFAQIDNRIAEIKRQLTDWNY